MIKHIPAIPPVLDEAHISQYHELLRDICLPVAKVGFHVADAVLAITEDFQNRQPNRMGEYLKQLGLGFKGLYIH